jgi:hypothetical protein
MSAMGLARTSTLPAKRERPSSSVASMAHPRCVPSSHPRAIAANANCSAMSRVYGVGIAVQRTMSGSTAISTSASRSVGTWARSVTTPSLRTGTLRGQRMPAA